jgi:hypothetical protein
VCGVWRCGLPCNNGVPLPRMRVHERAVRALLFRFSKPGTSTSTSPEHQSTSCVPHQSCGVWTAASCPPAPCGDSVRTLPAPPICCNARARTRQRRDETRRLRLLHHDVCAAVCLGDAGRTAICAQTRLASPKSDRCDAMLRLLLPNCSCTISSRLYFTGSKKYCT